MSESRTRVLVLGRDKEWARRAMETFSETHDFVRLPAGAERNGSLPGPDLLRAADELMARRPFGAVVATSESTMLAAGFLRSQYGLPGLDYTQSLLVTNKWRMRGRLGSVVPSPRAWLSGRFLADRPEDGTDVTEVVVKPIASSASRDVRRMPVDEARAWLAGQDGLWLVEEAVAVEREFHCDGAFHDGRVSWLMISEYDRPALQTAGTWGTSFLRRADPLRPRLTGLTHRVIEELGAGDGVFHVEFLYDGARLTFGEVGLRPAGAGWGELLHVTTGADIWGAFVAAQLGVDSGFAPLRPAAETSGMLWARPNPDGSLPLPASQAGRLPGVVLVGEGNRARGAGPANSCDFEYRVCFEGLTPEGVDRLRAAVTATSGAGPVAAGIGTAE
ncbi:ATP-grasp domain-containing protein [Streptomyces chrestomyceticus]|uniref:ATP-grasp domain-containing protein n=1 Tax=Streptomyces chrestomyceticus TaxID=68185 RepID=UPI0033E30151